MSTLTITIGILAPVITFLIGRYFRSEATKILLDAKQEHVSFWKGLYEQKSMDFESLNEFNEALAIQNTALLAQISDLATVQLVANKDKHPAANDNYLYIEGEINGNREAGLLKLIDWSKAKERLLKNPEDKLNNQ